MFEKTEEEVIEIDENYRIRMFGCRYAFEKKNVTSKDVRPRKEWIIISYEDELEDALRKYCMIILTKFIKTVSNSISDYLGQMKF